MEKAELHLKQWLDHRRGANESAEIVGTDEGVDQTQLLLLEPPG